MYRSCMWLIKFACTCAGFLHDASKCMQTYSPEQPVSECAHAILEVCVLTRVITVQDTRKPVSPVRCPENSQAQTCCACASGRRSDHGHGQSPSRRIGPQLARGPARWVTASRCRHACRPACLIGAFWAACCCALERRDHRTKENESIEYTISIGLSRQEKYPERSMLFTRAHPPSYCKTESR